ncbi:MULTISPECIES: phosphatidylglycerol--membrane-oligosaccharide glycerophosphotransferase [unclassified Pantoea]|uniref:phosphatidylglycerol--membrane-oligosaccharide glycerophosphotransferase n=1 Tax=unclassified Pantoea TaxID=2630326 RepID=UPI001CD3F046|nr:MULTISPECIES: phosphatidylglycerol--membrane-oligosaccharide glycerophosphotransferase [unclassified Pantoea]MCA1176230.1 phosphatidylglycerol--membrane-oligosaccharide glycerophosphotransferase [Pantoea sp. alder69]MCA1249200.1 phosphatidylglycerol--membrane-oligosaccharide glycerophosphotransferase [Pantoea sp. alder70]MCA1264725.1 phosphatidylglycerol--membrane-oligosaccharide glycerophosphotransferase [Pantoea sp. alder81]
MLSLFISIFFMFISLLLARKFISQRLSEKIFIISLYVLILFISCFYVGANYFTGAGINESVIYTLLSDLKGAGVQKYVFPFSMILFTFLCMVFMMWKAVNVNNSIPTKSSKKNTLKVFIVILASIVINPGVIGLYKIINTRLHDSKDFTKYYIDPSESTKKPTKNIIYIYGESLERTYFDKSWFPHLTDDLSSIKDKSYDFNNTIQLPGTDYTIAGIVSSQCGIPLFAPFSGNSSDSLASFFPGTTCLGDILKKSGYELYFYQGADLDFGGKRLFFENHGFDHIFGRQELAADVVDRSYVNDWGWYDDTVLDLAFKQYQKLSKSNKPFGLFLLTVDTHHPDGFVNKSCSKDNYLFNAKSNSSMSAVFCSQEQIAKFINKVKSSPEFKNTIIVVTSDHLAMNNTAYDALISHPRRDLFMLIDSESSAQKVDLSKERSSLDNGATVLDAMGGDSRIGLGRSSFKSETLYEKFPDMTEKVNSWKNSVIALWGFPKSIKNFTIHKSAMQIELPETSFKLPVLLKITKDSIEPYFDRDVSVSLATQLSEFSEGSQFLWVDDCFKITHVFSNKIEPGLCVAYGKNNGGVFLSKVDDDKIKFTYDISNAKNYDVSFKDRITQLKIPLRELKYPGNKIDFSYPGMPEYVKKITGLSHREDWGRWSDASLSVSVIIETKDPLPEDVSIDLDASAYKDGDGGLVDVTIGNETKRVDFKTIGNIQGLSFANRQHSNEILITPIHPSSPLSNGESGDARILGIGLRNLIVNNIR